MPTRSLASRSPNAGGFEVSRQRWLNREELAAFAKAMQDTPNFGRQNELAVWLLLALCVRKMELLSARWTEFDLEPSVWSLHPARGAGPAVAGGGPSVLVQQRVPVPAAPADPHEGRCAEAEPLRPHQPGHAERRVAPPAAGRHRALHRA